MPDQLDMKYVLMLTGGLVAGIIALFITLQKTRDREYETALKNLNDEKEANTKEFQEIKNTYRSIAQEAAQIAIDAVNGKLIKQDKQPVHLVADVVPESNSPPTFADREVAHIATLRATMAVLKQAMDQPPRGENH